MSSMTKFKKGDQVLHGPNKERGVINDGPRIENGLEWYLATFSNGMYACAGKDLEAAKDAKTDLPKSLCLTTGEILFSEKMVHIAAMYDRAERVKVAEEIAHRYNRYEELLAMVKMLAQDYALLDGTGPYDLESTTGRVRSILSKCEDR